jgi:hypothetical protein
MKQIIILNICHIKDYILEFRFDDDCVKQYDFAQLFTFKGISEPLMDIDYFKTAEIINGGRAFGWDNGYDCCADWIRYFAIDLRNEWKDVDDSFGLKQRIKLAKRNMKGIERVAKMSTF